jgi:competence protein ComEC
MKARTGATLPQGLLLLPLVALALFIGVSLQKPSGALRLWVLDVGQGDALLLQTPAGHTALIDGGPSATALNTAIGKHVPFWQNSLDLVVLTSPKEDSITGLVDLLGRRKVEQIVQTAFTPTTSVQGAWQEAVAQSSARLSTATRGDVITFDKEPDLALRVLYPPDGDTTGEAPVALQLEYNGTTVLLASNLTEQDETRLLALSTGDELKSDVLMVARHGSDGATTPRFIAATQPQAAIISVGAGNRTNDPSSEVLQRLNDAGARIYRTDQNGEIELTLKNSELIITPQRPTGDQ